MDLALALIEEDHGADVARAVARWTVMFLQRPGGQSQFSERLAIPAGVAASLRKVLDQVVAEPAADHRLAELAKRASLSERHFRRIFFDRPASHRRASSSASGSRPPASCLSAPPHPSMPSPRAAASAAPRRCDARSCASSASARRITEPDFDPAPPAPWPPDPEGRARLPSGRAAEQRLARAPSAASRRCGNAARPRLRCPLEQKDRGTRTP